MQYAIYFEYLCFDIFVYVMHCTCSNKKNLMKCETKYVLAFISCDDCFIFFKCNFFSLQDSSFTSISSCRLAI